MGFLALTGFGPFVGVELNPSGEVARALGATPPAGLDVRAEVLPVSLEDSPGAFDRWFDGQVGEVSAVLCLGVHKDAYFRLERRASSDLHSLKFDNDGRQGRGFRCGGEPQFETALDLLSLSAAMRAAGAESVRISEDAGGFVCERVYHHALSRGAAGGFPALFLHVPPLHACALAKQVVVVTALAQSLISATS